jgi:hypothetical protein
LTKDEVIQLSESLLVSAGLFPKRFLLTVQFVFRNEPGDVYLATVSKFILNAYEFGDATAPDSPALGDVAPIIGDQDSASITRARSDSEAIGHNTPYLSTWALAAWRGILS